VLCLIFGAVDYNSPFIRFAKRKVHSDFRDFRFFSNVSAYAAPHGGDEFREPGGNVEFEQAVGGFPSTKIYSH